MKLGIDAIKGVPYYHKPVVLFYQFTLFCHEWFVPPIVLFVVFTPRNSESLTNLFNRSATVFSNMYELEMLFTLRTISLNGF